ncbi:MAG: beta-ketoacyl-ACP synthase II [Candidatus Roseilinea sp.]|uniref:beta-ketoacyl-ACP synthase II n=1 Tax=Candidatus Roseilinea sp. TaxID=2838777 RepID=UPI004049562E
MEHKLQAELPSVSHNGRNEHRPHRVVITGIGLVSPMGNDVQSSWQMLLSAKSGCAPITLYDRSQTDVQIACEVKDFDPAAHFGPRDARRLDRCAQFALVATKEALQDAGLTLDEDNTYDVGVVLGSGIGGISTLTAEHAVMLQKGPKRVSPFAVPMMLPDTATGQVAMHFGIRGPNYCVVSACASGTNAIGEAFELLRAGRAQAVVAGGTEAPINAFSIAAFSNMGALSTCNDDPEGASRPFDATRNGFVCGEGAGILILETLEHAQRRGARIHAEVLGYGVTADAHHITAPDVKGPAMAMRAAIAQAGISPAMIDYLNAHGTSTQLNDSNETRAIKMAFGEAAYDLHISSTKSMTGHLLGAAGALEAIICVLSIRDGVILPTINYHNPDPECDLNYTPNSVVRKPVRIAMSNSFGFGGHNGCLVIGQFTE